MTLLGIWLAVSVLIGVGWAITGLLLRERSEDAGAIEAEADDEAA